MKCWRCNSEVFFPDSEYILDDPIQFRLDLLRCPCGERYDAVIEANRALSRPVEMVVCACGCEQSLPKYSEKTGLERHLIHGHANKRGPHPRYRQKMGRMVY